MWNVKYGIIIPDANKKRINRNIVECKAYLTTVNYTANWELIETLWNVKKGKPTAQTIATEELIETLWNVKSNKTQNLRCRNLN